MSIGLSIVVLFEFEEGIDIGVSFKYNRQNDKIQVTGLHLDKELLQNQHTLADPQHEYKRLDSFESYINDINIGNPDDGQNEIKDLQSRNAKLKQNLHDFVEIDGNDSAKVVEMQQFVQQQVLGNNRKRNDQQSRNTTDKPNKFSQ